MRAFIERVAASIVIDSWSLGKAVLRKLLAWAYRRKFKSVGNNLKFDPLTSFFHYDKIEIGDNVFINRDAYFSGAVMIGNDVMFGPGVFITDGYHKYDVVGKTINRSGAGEKVGVVIADDVWIGARVSLHKGVAIGEGTVIGAMSVVTRSLPPYVVAVGNPCRPIKKRFSDEQLAVHLIARGRSSEEASKVIEERNRYFVS